MNETVKALREEIRNNRFNRPTSGLAAGILQGNLIVMQAQYAQEFLEFCQLNSKPCPVIGVSEVGDYRISALGDIDIRTDVPEYHIFDDGTLLRSVQDIKDEWRDDSVAIVLGCSYSFEEAIQSHGYAIRNIDQKRNVSMYNTTIATTETEHFGGNQVVSMRPFKNDAVERIISITSHFEKAHGDPLHIGNPEMIGIKDMSTPDYGDAVEIFKDEVPLFWACGVTSQVILKQSKLPFIAHAPGKMLITDIVYE